MGGPRPSRETDRGGPLAFMTKVSPWVSLYRPEDNPSSASTDAPILVILFTWMNANTTHIAKYARGYQELYPSAQILLICSGLKHVLWRPSTPSSDVRPAIPIIRSAIETASNDSNPHILIHSWSNGGSAMLSHLRAAYSNGMPPHITIFDSGPGLYSHAHGLKSNTIGMSAPMKLVSYPIMTIISVLYVLWYFGRANAFTWYYRAHNLAQGEVRRTYIYSKSDQLISYTDIEAHARKAKEKGYQVNLELFEGTQHVSHVRGNEERYWNVVRGIWKS